VSGPYYFILLTFLSAKWNPQSITSNNTLAGDTMKTTVLLQEITKNQHTVTELLPTATTSPQKLVSLIGLPLELLFMIFDYAACRDHLEDPRYLIQSKKRVGSGRTLVISQPALLMVCTSLRSALSDHFYSSCYFHAKIETRWMLESFADGLTVQQIEDKLPHPLKLSSIKLTMEIRELSSQGFNLSILVNLGEKLFIEYRTMKLSSRDGVKLMNLRWRFVCTDPSLPNDIRSAFNDEIRSLLKKTQEVAARSAIVKTHSLQAFSPVLEKWLRGIYVVPDDDTRLRAVLGGHLRTTRSVTRALSRWYGNS
jgi:hypothetical protein